MKKKKKGKILLIIVIIVAVVVNTWLYFRSLYIYIYIKQPHIVHYLLTKTIEIKTYKQIFISQAHGIDSIFQAVRCHVDSWFWNKFIMSMIE